MKNPVILATPEDGEEMLHLIEAQSAKGKFELLYTRRPNAFLSFLQENPQTRIGMIRNPADHKIAAQFIVSPGKYYLNGAPVKVGYVNGVRKAMGYRGALNWKGMSDFVKAMDCDLYTCSFLAENQDIMRMFTKKRACFPKLFFLCDYTTYIINPRSIKPIDSATEYDFRRMEEKDGQRVLNFLAQEGSRYQLAPVVDAIEDFYCLQKGDCYLLEKDGELKAFGALWNQSSYKQYIAIRYSGYMKVLSCFPQASALLGYVPIPPLGMPLNFPMLSLFYAKKNNPIYYRIFLSLIAGEIKKKYTMFLIGMTAEHPNKHIYQRIKSFHLQSAVYYVNYEQNIVFDKGRPIHLECGLL